MKRISAVVAGLLVGGVVWSSTASANLVVNGDFENDLNSWTAVQRVVTETSQRYIDLAGAKSSSSGVLRHNRSVNATMRAFSPSSSSS